MKSDLTIRSVLSGSAIIVVLSALTIWLGVAISATQAKVGWRVFSGTLAGIVAVWVFLIWIYARVIRGSLQEQVEEVNRVLRSIERSAVTATDNLSWLLTLEQLVEIEQNIDAAEIWLISPDLAEDDDPNDPIVSPFVSPVALNLKRGLRYVFFIPDTPAMHAKADQVRAIHGNHRNLRVRFLESDFFFLVKDFDFVIYDR